MGAQKQYHIKLSLAPFNPLYYNFNMNRDEESRLKVRFEDTEADGKAHRYRWREPKILRELRNQDPDNANTLHDYAIESATLVNDLAQIPGGRMNQFDQKEMNFAEMSYEMQLIAPTLALYKNDNLPDEEKVDHGKIAELATVMHLDKLDNRNLPESLIPLQQEWLAGKSREALFLREVNDNLNQPEELSGPDYPFDLPSFIQTVHTYIHSTETTRVPLLDPLCHENNAEHSLQGALFGVCARDFIIKNKFERAKEIVGSGDRSFLEVAWFQAIHDLPEIITGDVQTYGISESDKKAKELVETSAASLLHVILPDKLANEISIYEKRGGIFRQGFTRMSDKNGPLAVDKTGRNNAGIAAIALLGTRGFTQLLQNDIRLTLSKCD